MRLFAFVAAIILLGGCAQNTAGISIESRSQHVVLADHGLALTLEFGAAESMSVNEHLKAMVSVTSKVASTQTLVYRFYWYNDQGLEVNVRKEPWRHVTLTGYDSTTLEAMSVSPDAVNYRVVVKSQN
ncbi:YcfL family protein [Parasalinivibrio latis]|uniref:YcfL family protein n=1 Tax=Parasalinivibrio latis TaxID=2952610 RepID=UPI0030E018DC